MYHTLIMINFFINGKKLRLNLKRLDPGSVFFKGQIRFYLSPDPQHWFQAGRG